MESLLLIVTLFLSFFLNFAAASCGHGTSLLKRSVHFRREEGKDVKTVEVGKFGYLGTIGPTNWAGLTPENVNCSISKQQSPIDVTNTSTTLVAPGSLSITLPNVEAAEFENIGTTIEVVMEGKGASVVVEGKTFDLKQFHMHSPSEHTINGEYFPLEMHMVHESIDGEIAVIAVQFQLSEAGETSALLTTIGDKTAAISTPGSVTETGPLDFVPLVDNLSKQSFHTYTGSLTTPPCAEGLTFYITQQQLPLDVSTFNNIKKAVGFNARFAQNNIGQDNLLVISSRTVNDANAKAASVAAKLPATGAKSTVSSSNVITGESIEKAHETVKVFTTVDLSTS